MRRPPPASPRSNRWPFIDPSRHRAAWNGSRRGRRRGRCQPELHRRRPPSVRATPPTPTERVLSRLLPARPRPPAGPRRPVRRAGTGQAITGLLCRPGLPLRQRTGTIGLFGGGSQTDAWPGGGLGNPSRVSRLLRMWPRASTATVSRLATTYMGSKALLWICIRCWYRPVPGAATDGLYTRPGAWWRIGTDPDSYSA